MVGASVAVVVVVMMEGKARLMAHHVGRMQEDYVSRMWEVSVCGVLMGRGRTANFLKTDESRIVARRGSGRAFPAVQPSSAHPSALPRYNFTV